ncbi:MAG: hypothetical protein ACHP9T_15650, partial [Caulobacterales bacterium]
MGAQILSQASRAAVLPRRFHLSPRWFGQLSTPGRYGVAVAIVALASGAAEMLDRMTGSNRVAG